MDTSSSTLVVETYPLKNSIFGSHAQIADLVRADSTVLDVGCGAGHLSQKLSKKSVRCTGIDQHLPNEVWPGLANYHQCDLESPKALEGKFDYVIMGDLIEHVRNPGVLLSHFKNNLKPNGKLIASTGNVAIWLYRLSLLFGKFDYTERGILDRTHVHLYTCQSFQRLLESCGYQINSKRYTNLPFEAVLPPDAPGLGLLDWMYRPFVAAWPKMFAYQIILEATPQSEAQELS